MFCNAANFWVSLTFMLISVWVHCNLPKFFGNLDSSNKLTNRILILEDNFVRWIFWCYWRMTACAASSYSHVLSGLSLLRKILVNLALLQYSACIILMSCSLFLLEFSFFEHDRRASVKSKLRSNVGWELLYGIKSVLKYFVNARVKFEVVYLLEVSSFLDKMSSLTWIVWFVL